MRSLTQPAPRNIWRELWAHSRAVLATLDRAAWIRFFLALFTLSFSFFLALLSAALNQSGHHALGPACAALSLLLAGIIAVKVVPFLARRTKLERWVMKIEYEFTREGAVYLMIIAVIIVAALNTGNNLLFIILASLLAGILVSGILSKIVLSELELEFVLPDHLFAGQPVISRLTLQNLKWFLPSFSMTVAARDPAQNKKPKAAVTLCRQILDEPVYLPYVPHRSSVTQHVELTFPHRGRYTQEGFRVSTKFPFGFMKKTREVSARQEILVLPGIEPTEEFAHILPLVSGEVESYFKGHGHDLYGIRDYQESDTARHVDWKASARSQQLKVREFTREDDRRVVLVFDARLPEVNDKTPAQFEKAVNLCACLAWHFCEVETQLQFITNGFETVMASARDVVYPALETLALIEPKVERSPADAPAVPSLIPPSVRTNGFHIIISCQPRGSLSILPLGPSHTVYMDSL
ncbi:MAG TPA: DUF58 domain-containing protein [Terriglobia bacterium]|nr:DUF58 domain-containing protein [Terriglobia bacterium]